MVVNYIKGLDEICFDFFDYIVRNMCTDICNYFIPNKEWINTTTSKSVCAVTLGQYITSSRLYPLKMKVGEGKSMANSKVVILTGKTEGCYHDILLSGQD